MASTSLATAARTASLSPWSASAALARSLATRETCFVCLRRRGLETRRRGGGGALVIRSVDWAARGEHLRGSARACSAGASGQGRPALAVFCCE